VAVSNSSINRDDGTFLQRVEELVFFDSVFIIPHLALILQCSEKFHSHHEVTLVVDLERTRRLGDHDWYLCFEFPSVLCHCCLSGGKGT